jgi:hypothetical protein
MVSPLIARPLPSTVTDQYTEVQCVTFSSNAETASNRGGGHSGRGLSNHLKWRSHPRRHLLACHPARRPEQADSQSTLIQKVANASSIHFIRWDHAEHCKIGHNLFPELLFRDELLFCFASWGKTYRGERHDVGLSHRATPLRLPPVCRLTSPCRHFRHAEMRLLGSIGRK